MSLFDRSSSLAATLSNSAGGNGCVPYDPNAKAPTYGYDPSLYVSPQSLLFLFDQMLSLDEYLGGIKIAVSIIADAILQIK